MGRPEISSVGFLPNLSHVQPPTKVPIVPPTPKMAATHATSDNRNGPVSSGVSSDSSTRRAADVQPTAVPYEMVIIFAVFIRGKNIVQINKVHISRIELTSHRTILTAEHK